MLLLDKDELIYITFFCICRMKVFLVLGLSLLAFSLLITHTSIDANAQIATDIGNGSESNPDQGLAQSTYEQKKAVVDQSVKNFIVLIPNEGHESVNQPKNQWPLANG